MNTNGLEQTDDWFVLCGCWICSEDRLPRFKFRRFDDSHRAFRVLRFLLRFLHTKQKTCLITALSRGLY